MWQDWLRTVLWVLRFQYYCTVCVHGADGAKITVDPRKYYGTIVEGVHDFFYRIILILRERSIQTFIHRAFQLHPGPSSRCLHISLDAVGLLDAVG